MGAPRSAELNLSCPRMMNGPFPHYLLLPDVSNLKPSDWNLRYLAKLSDAINQIDYRKTLPFLRLMDFFKDGLVDGCSLTILEKSTFCRPSICKVPPSIVDYLVQCVASDYDILNDSLVIFDDESSVCYLTLPLGKFDGLNGDYLLLLWKHNSIFTSDDVATVKLALQLFRGRFHEIGLDDAASHLAERVWDSDEALRAVLNAIPDLVIVCAQNGKVLGFNEAAQRSFRCLIPVRDAANGTTWMRELAHPDDAPYLLDVWTEATHDQVSRKLRCRLLIERSVYHKVLWRFSPIRDQNENTLWAIVATDLEIGETSDEVRSMAVMKGRFLAEISHEIRTPLACILGTSTLLSHTNLDADQQELLRTISLSSQQLSSLISNVLDLSRIEENKLVLERIPIMIEKSVHEVVELFRTNLVRMKIDTIIEIHPAVPEWIISDELCLRQVLTNLLGNAIKFSPPDSVVVVRVARIVVNDVEYVKFYVEDEGPGISEETGKRLFESFSQADVSTARKYGGSGLGLVISKVTLYVQSRF